MSRYSAAVHHQSPPEAKIALFRLLFRGRDDVYPCRFESRTLGKSGYSPACGNEWVSGICEKPRVKCADCRHRQFLPVTDEVIRWYLSGRDDRAFLYRRLETLPETSGQFRLNAELPIPFDGWGKMEVDLLCSPARLAIELDGAQHLAGADAYRRDRRKDVLLQENGYFVLRFLTEDVRQRLDAVLDAILRALSRREA